MKGEFGQKARKLEGGKGNNVATRQGRDGMKHKKTKYAEDKAHGKDRDNQDQDL